MIHVLVCRISKFLSYMGKDLVSTACAMAMWRNDIKCKYMFLFPLKNLADKGLSHWHAWWCYVLMLVTKCTCPSDKFWNIFCKMVAIFFSCHYVSEKHLARYFGSHVVLLCPSDFPFLYYMLCTTLLTMSSRTGRWACYTPRSSVLWPWWVHSGGSNRPLSK